jgi:hypothetical protein
VLMNRSPKKPNIAEITTAVAAALKWQMVFACMAVVVVGCASSDVNPRHASATMGYVDFYGKRASHLSWQVDRFDDNAHKFRRILSDWEAPPEGILRLEVAAGRHRLRITCLNLSTTGPAEIEVAVENGKITPVFVVMKKAGSSEVETEETNVGDTLYGRYGRNTRISYEAEDMYRVSATADPPADYRVKAEMPYALQIKP